MLGNLRPEELEKKFRDTYTAFGMDVADHSFVTYFLANLKTRHPIEYAHSLRVALLTKELARVVLLEEPIALYRAATFHRVAKRKLKEELKIRIGNDIDRGPSVDQHEQIKDYHEQAYWIIQNMRVYSPDGQDLSPVFQKGTSEKEKLAILEQARLVQVLNMYDAFRNKRTPVTNLPILPYEEVKSELIKLNIDKVVLIERLYRERIFN